jgi:hypothetical protein
MKELKVFVDRDGFVNVPINQDGLKTVSGNIEVVRENGNVIASGKQIMIGFQRTILTIFTLEGRKKINNDEEICITIMDDKVKIKYQNDEFDIRREIGEAVRFGPVELEIKMVFGEMWAW